MVINRFFSEIRYLNISYLPYCVVYKLVENSGGNILEINILYHRYEGKNPIYTKNYWNQIAKNCPKIEKLKV